MELKKISVSDLIRSVMVGIYALFIGFVLNISEIRDLVKNANNTKLLAISIVLGTVFYFCYRSVIYQLVLYQLSDMKNNTANNWVKKYFSCLSWSKRTELVHFLRKDKAIDEKLGVDLWSSSVHMQYMCALINLLYFIHCICSPSYNWVCYIVLVSTAYLLFAGGHLSDQSLERRICLELRSKLPEDEMKEQIEKMAKEMAE